MKTGMPILYENPREVGADRVVNAVAAYERWRCGLVVVDFGTATTFDEVSPKAVPGGRRSARASPSRWTRCSPRLEAPARRVPEPPHVVAEHGRLDSERARLRVRRAGRRDLRAYGRPSWASHPRWSRPAGLARSSPACRRRSRRWTSTSRSTVSASCTSETGDRPDLHRRRPPPCPQGTRPSRRGSPRSPRATWGRPTTRSGAPTVATRALPCDVVVRRHARARRAQLEPRRDALRPGAARAVQTPSSCSTSRACTSRSTSASGRCAIARGLERWPDDRRLLAARAALGTRSAPVLPFLPRKNLLNRTLGRLRHRWRQRRSPAYELSPLALGLTDDEKPQEP